VEELKAVLELWDPWSLLELWDPWIILELWDTLRVILELSYRCQRI
jgi:hypothetical protein